MATTKCGHRTKASITTRRCFITTGVERFTALSDDYNKRIVTEAFALEGIKVTYGFFPWKRAYLEAKRGLYDGSVVWSKNTDREAGFYFSNAIFSDEKVLFHLKTFHFDWNTTEDLKEMEIGVSTLWNGRKPIRFEI